MANLYNVQMTYVAVVIAEDKQEAMEIARRESRQITSDSGPEDFMVTHEIICKSDFRDGWDADCIPYGGDAHTRIGEIDENLK